MASVQQDPSGNFHVCFRFGGQRYKRSLKTRLQRKAEAAASRIGENNRLVDEGRIELPEDVDIPVYLLSDGKLAEKPKRSKTIRLGTLFDDYLQSIPADSLESTSIATMRIHVRHVQRIIGASRTLRSLQKADLQAYVTTRSREPGRRGTVSAATIRKEVATFSSLWTWARTDGFVEGEFPRNGLVFPKATERSQFQTWEQITRQIRENNLPLEDASLLWDCLYLSRPQLAKLLSFIKAESGHDCLYPMCVLAAYTGARRSEICRSMVADVDLVASTFSIRERKRSRSHRTTRTVPMCEILCDAISHWLSIKPQCRFLFPEDHRSVRLRCPDQEKGQIKPFESSNFLDSILSGSQWESIRGWHVFRHSFISNCASKGVDQRFIDQWVGHQTDEQRRRYRHLFPDSQQKAIDSVFY